MGEKDELKRIFIGEKEIDTSGIPEFPGDLINYSLQSVGKEFEFRTKFELPKEVFYSLFFPNQINQNNFRKIHGFPQKHKIAGRKGVRKKELKSAFESEGINFSEYMNAPEPWNGQALIRNINGTKYVCCPFCQKKALLISPETKIQHLKLKCKGSNCKKEFEVNV